MDLFWFCIAFFIIDAPITLFSDKGRFDSIALHIRMLVLEEGISDSQEIISFLVLAFPLSLRKIHPPTTIWTLLIHPLGKCQCFTAGHCGEWKG